MNLLDATPDGGLVATRSDLAVRVGQFRQLLVDLVRERHRLLSLLLFNHLDSVLRLAEWRSGLVIDQDQFVVRMAAFVVS